MSYTSVSELMTGICDAVRAKDGTTEPIPHQDIPDRIAAIPAGGGDVVEKDVNFYDFDGTLVAGYTVAEAQTLTELPTPPDHSRDTVPLTFQGWNYTLEQILAAQHVLDVGATYIPVDGKTWFRIRVTANITSSFPFCFTKTNATDTLVIDYGDGQIDSDDSNSEVAFSPATSLSVGDHWVSVWISNGTGNLVFGQEDSFRIVVGGDFETEGNGYCTLMECYIGKDVAGLEGFCRSVSEYPSIDKLTIPENVATIGLTAFKYMSNLETIVIPKSVTTLGADVFESDSRLKIISIPESVTEIGIYAFKACRALKRLLIPDNVSAIAEGTFDNCIVSQKIYLSNNIKTIELGAFKMFRGVIDFVVPDGVTAIGSSAFRNCDTLRTIRLPPSLASLGSAVFWDSLALIDIVVPCVDPPILNDTAFFYNTNDLCRIHVPAASLSAYQSATNWSIYADRIIAIVE